MQQEPGPFDFTDEPTTRDHVCLPDAHRVYDLIVHAAERQLATSPEARLIFAAGLEAQLREFLAQVAANAANPIADEVSDAAVCR